MEENIFQDQNVIIESRKKINISGVKEVLSFDEETLLLDTSLGKMTIKGENLHIASFNTETGDLVGDGKVHAVVYMSDAQSGGFFTRIFK